MKLQKVKILKTINFSCSPKTAGVQIGHGDLHQGSLGQSWNPANSKDIDDCHGVAAKSLRGNGYLWWVRPKISSRCC